MKTLRFFFLLIFSLFFVSIVSAEMFGYGRTESIPINYSLIPTVNNSQYFQGYTPTTLGNWLESTFGWITNTVSTLGNYYLKTEVYNKSEVGDLLNNTISSEGLRLGFNSTFNSSYDSHVNWTDGAGATENFRTVGNGTFDRITIGEGQKLTFFEDVAGDNFLQMDTTAQAGNSLFLSRLNRVNTFIEFHNDETEDNIRISPESKFQILIQDSSELYTFGLDELALTQINVNLINGDTEVLADLYTDGGSFWAKDGSNFYNGDAKDVGRQFNSTDYITQLLVGSTANYYISDFAGVIINSNITTNESFIGDGSQLTNLPIVNPFDQSLNTTDDVTFNSVITSNITASSGSDLNITLPEVKQKLVIFGNATDRMDPFFTFGTVNTNDAENDFPVFSIRHGNATNFEGSQDSSGYIDILSFMDTGIGQAVGMKFTLNAIGTVAQPIGAIYSLNLGSSSGSSKAIVNLFQLRASSTATGSQQLIGNQMDVVSMGGGGADVSLNKMNAVTTSVAGKTSNFYLNNYNVQVASFVVGTINGYGLFMENGATSGSFGTGTLNVYGIKTDDMNSPTFGSYNKTMLISAEDNAPIWIGGNSELRIGGTDEDNGNLTISYNGVNAVYNISSGLHYFDGGNISTTGVNLRTPEYKPVSLKDMPDPSTFIREGKTEEEFHNIFPEQIKNVVQVPDYDSPEITETITQRTIVIVPEGKDLRKLETEAFDIIFPIEGREIINISKEGKDNGYININEDTEIALTQKQKDIIVSLDSPYSQIIGNQITGINRKTTYPYSKPETQVSVGDWLMQDYSLIYQLKEENNLLKSELCKKDNSYSWCGPTL